MMLRSTLLESDLLTSHHRLPAGGGRRRASIVFGHPGRCPAEPTHLCLIFDNSGSVGSPGGNDPVGARFEEARLAIDAVARRCRCENELVSILHFDTPTSGDVQPTPLKRVREIDRGLAIPSNGGGSSILGPSLKAAHGFAQQLPNHNHILVVLSDYLLFDNRVDDVLDDFSAFAGSVHAVVLRAEPPARFEDDDRICVTRVDYGDDPGRVGHAVFDALTTHRQPRRGRRESPTT